MQQLLSAHGISTRMVDLGLVAYTGLGSSAALQVRSEDEQTAQLLLSPVDDQPESQE